MDKKSKHGSDDSAVLNEHLIDAHYDLMPVTSGIFEGLSVQEARDLNDEAEQTGEPIEKLVQEHHKKKAAEEEAARKKATKKKAAEPEKKE